QGPPDVDEVRDVSGAFEQLVDEALALVGGGVRQEGTHLGHGWNLAGQVEVDAAEEFSVLGGGGRLDLGGGPAGGEVLVDLARQRLDVAGGIGGGVRSDRVRHGGQQQATRGHPPAAIHHGPCLLSAKKVLVQARHCRLSLRERAPFRGAKG